ncbi:hypothetical protein HF205_07895 [Rhizobium leguminosarum]|nr:transketolase C-terminal domain-containing protein [Rhizobium leguminosarum]MBY2946827.1 hypothetical protein [Rhizobium leguminosarum]
MPPVRTVHTDENLSSTGAYVLAEAAESRAATILATGSEVSIAMAAREALSTKGIQVAVVSMPSWELFDEQEENYRQNVLGTAPRVAIEAGTSFGWAKYVGADENVICVAEFGASADWKTMYEKYNITAAALENLVLKVLKADNFAEREI